MKFLILCFCLLSGPLNAADQGAFLYDQGRFDESYEWYLKEVQETSHHHSGYLLYNLGNAAAMSGRRDAAIAAYFMAFPLLPRYENIQENLKQLLSVNYDAWQQSYQDSWHGLGFLSLLNLREWVQVTLILCLSGGVCFLLKRRKLSMVVMMLCAVSLAAVISYDVCAPHWSVTSAEEPATMYSGPGTFNAVLGEVGTLIPLEVLQEFNGWSQIRVYDSQQEGWVPSSSLKRLSNGHPS